MPKLTRPEDDGSPHNSPSAACSAPIKRRELIKASLGLVVAFGWIQRPISARQHPTSSDARVSFAPNAFIQIGTDGVVSLVMPFVEMGQGAYTGQATLLAEELCIDLEAVRVEHAPADERRYALETVGSQVTGGSMSMRASWTVLRNAGAIARTMLVKAAASRWKVPAAECHALGGAVHHASSGRSAPYSQLAAAAAGEAVPENPELLSASQFRLISKPQRRIDVGAKTDGSCVFGIDVQFPGLRIVAVRACPVLGGQVRKVDEAPARATAGVIDVVVLQELVAVVAKDFWTAQKGARALLIEWDYGNHATLMSDGIEADMAAHSVSGTALVAKKTAPAAPDWGAGRTVEAVYELPMLAHAAMEPLSATVSVTQTKCDIWLGTQVPSRVAERAAQITGLALDKITVHNHYIGGSFGRRLETDTAEQALQIATRLRYPIKLIWTREQDLAFDYFRPPYHDHCKAQIDASGYPAIWFHRTTSEALTARWDPPSMGKDGVDPDAVDGAIEPPYSLPNMRVEWVRHRLPTSLTTGWWRGVGQTHNLFPVESFIDELAHASHQDPVAYRRALLKSNARATAVLDLAASKFGWGAKTPSRTGAGVALGMPMGTYICAMLEVDVSPEFDIRLRRAVVAVDCGIAVNPDTVVAQVEGGLLFGFSAALYSGITIKDGVIEQSNFNNYRVIRMNEVPTIEVHIMPSRESPTGIGEPPTAIAAPTLANAVFAATGLRVRRLPIARSLKQHARIRS